MEPGLRKACIPEGEAIPRRPGGERARSPRPRCGGLRGADVCVLDGASRPRFRVKAHASPVRSARAPGTAVRRSLLTW